MKLLLSLTILNSMNILGFFADMTYDLKDNFDTEVLIIYIHKFLQFLTLGIE